MATLYSRIQHGKRVRYEPVAEQKAWDSFPAGAHLIIVQPGIKSTRYNIKPDHAAVLAAVAAGRDAMRDKLAVALAPKAEGKLTPAEQAAFDQWKAATGRDTLRAYWPALSDAIDAFTDAVAAAAVKG